MSDLELSYTYFISKIRLHCGQNISKVVSSIKWSYSSSIRHIYRKVIGLDLSLKVHKDVNNIGPAPVFVNTIL